MLKTVFILALWSVVLSERAGREDWLDPNDMLNFDPSTGTMRNKPKHEESTRNKFGSESAGRPSSTSTQSPPPSSSPSSSGGCPIPKECKCDQAGLPLTRQFVKSLLEHLHGQMPHGHPEEYNMYITLSPDHVQMLKSFVLLGDQRHIHDVNEILIGMVNRVISSKLGRIEKTLEWVESKIGVTLHRLLQLLSLVGLASLILVIEVKLQIHWRRRLWQLIILLFIVSVPWTWYELLKQAEIKQQSVAMKNMPAECRNGTVDFWTTIKSYIFLQDDKCHAYYEHLMIDPIVKVPPTKAIAVTFVRFFLAPLKDVGTAVSEFIRALLIDLPLTLYPVAIAIVTVFSFMFLFMWFGYSIRLPFFLTIERPPQLSVADSKLNEALTESSKQIMKQLEDLQNRIEASEANTAENLRHLQQAQQLAIEYSMSSGAGSPQPSPTVHVTRSASYQPTVTPDTVCSNNMSPTLVLGATASSDQAEPNKSTILNGEPEEAEKNDDSFLVVNSDSGDVNSVGLSLAKDNIITDKQTQKLKVDTLMPAGIDNSE